MLIPEEVAKLIPIGQLEVTKMNPLAYQDDIELLKKSASKMP